MTAETNTPQSIDITRWRRIKAQLEYNYIRISEQLTKLETESDLVYKILNERDPDWGYLFDEAISLLAHAKHESLKDHEEQIESINRYLEAFN